MKHLFLSILFTASTASIAIAQPKPTKPTTDATQMAKDDCARARAAGKTCVLNIDDGEDFKGAVPTAGDGQITTIDWGKTGSLIRLRRDFIVEILKSAEDL